MMDMTLINFINQSLATSANTNAATALSTAQTITDRMQYTSAGSWIRLGTDASVGGGMSATAIGVNARAFGEGTIAIGYNANSNAINSIAIGAKSNAIMGGDIAIGFAANTKSTFSIAIGEASTISREYSLALGVYTNVTSAYSTAIGYKATTHGLGSVSIGTDSITSNANSIQLGSSGLSSITSVITSITSQSDERDKIDIEELKDGAIEFLNKIKAIRYNRNLRINYQYNEEDLDEESLERRHKYGLYGYDKEAHVRGDKKGQRKRVGVLAQEVQRAMKEVYGDDSYGNLVNDNLYDFEDIPDDVESQLGVTYANFIPFLIKAIQELSSELEELKSKIPVS